MRHILKNISVFKILLLVVFIEFFLWIVFAGISFHFTKTSVNANVSCTQGVTTFTDALLLSIETGVTIGYGTRAITSSCYGLITCWLIFILSTKISEGMVLGLLLIRFNEWIKLHRCRHEDILIDQ